MIVELDKDHETGCMAVIDITDIKSKNPENRDPSKVDVDVEFDLLAVYRFKEGAD